MCNNNNNNKTSLLLPCLTLTFAGLVGSGSLLAAQVGAEFRLGYVYTDNVTRVGDNEIDDSIWTVGTSIVLTEATRKMSADVRTVLDYLNYETIFDSEVVGGLDAIVDFTLIDERLTWNFQDNYGQRLFNPFDTPTPGNREDVNFFSTGPEFELPVGSRHFVGVGGRYSNVNYEVTPDDNERISGFFQFARRSNAETNISLNVSTESVEFSDDDASIDFDVREAFIGYEVNSTRNFININAGYTEVDTGFDVLDGYLLRVDWTRIVSQQKSILLSGGSQFSTQGDIFRFSQTNGRDIGDTVDVNVIDVPFRSHFFFGRYNVDSDRTGITFEVEWIQDDYEGETPTGPGGALQSLDRDVIRGEFSVERDISRKIFVDFSLEYGTRDFKFLNRKDDDLSVIATLGYRFSPALNAYFSLLHFDRESSAAVSSFTDERVMLGVAYIPAWGRSLRAD